MKKLGTVTLETDRLILRRFESRDAEAMYYSWGSDKNSNKYLDWNLHKSVEDSKKIVDIWMKEYEEGAYNWIVELKDTHEVIGSITGVHVRENDMNVEIGYCYGSKYWNCGYATEALRRVIEFFLFDVGMYLVEAMHIGGNPASGRVMQKSGMKKEAVLRKRKLNKYTKELDDLIVYSITKDEFKK